jgi:hypothetical protein
VIVDLHRGTPGIGKSVQFGNYLFLQAARARRNIYYDSVRGNEGYLFKADDESVYYVDPRHFRGAYAEPLLGLEGLYLMDAGAKGQHREPLSWSETFTVVTASPNEKHYGNFVKERAGRGECSELFVSPWTWEEVERVLPWVVLPDEPNLGYEEKKNRVRERFDIFGGVVRILFGSQVNFLDAKSFLRQAISSMSDFDYKLLQRAEPRWEVVPRNEVKLTFPLSNVQSFLGRKEVDKVVIPSQPVILLPASKINGFVDFIQIFNNKLYFILITQAKTKPFPLKDAKILAEKCGSYKEVYVIYLVDQKKNATAFQIKKQDALMLKEWNNIFSHTQHGSKVLGAFLLGFRLLPTLPYQWLCVPLSLSGWLSALAWNLCSENSGLACGPVVAQ